MKKLIRAFSLFSIFFLLYSCSSSGNTYMEKRAAIDKMSADAVSKLSEKNATASREIKNGYGYAVFSNSNVTVLFVGGSGGYGVLHNNQSGENTYMKMGGANVGIGLGMKNIRIVFTFKTKKAFDNFKENGWLGGAQADATAKSKQKGGANDVQVDTSGTHTYVMTNEGVALQASIQGSKYWKDDSLN